MGASLAEFIEWPLTRQAFSSLPAREQIEPAARALQRLLLSGVLDALEPDASERKDDGNFYGPSEEELPAPSDQMKWVWSYLAAFLFRFSQEHLPTASWPATLTREGVMLFSGQPKYADPELTRIFESPATGPVGHLAGALLLARIGNRNGSAQFAQRGLHRLNREDFQRDAALLLGIADSYVRKSRKPLETFTSLAPDELAALLQLLPLPTRAFLVRSIAALKLQPEKSLRAVLEPLLAEWWRSGLEADLERALRAALAKATARSEIEMIFAQAVARFEGRDGPVNLAEAARLFRQAAERGSAGGAYQLGLMHEQGLGLERSTVAALPWYGRAASNGVVEAQMKLAEIYSLGSAVPADYVTATFWYRVAELGGEPTAGARANATARRLTAEQQVQVMRRLRLAFPGAPTGGARPRPPGSP